jgi:dihydroneopterin aldolase
MKKQTVGRIALEQVEMFAFHGWHDEEKKTGCKFLVDVVVETGFGEQTDFDSIRDTVDYEVLFTILKKHMDKPERLLELLCKNITDEILQRYPHIHSAEVSIKKLNPPIKGMKGNSSVSLKQVNELS